MKNAFFRVTNPQTPSQKLKVVLAAKAVHIQYILCTNIIKIYGCVKEIVSVFLPF